MSNVEQTLSIIKPDAVERNLENEIKEMFKTKGFKIIKEKKKYKSKNQKQKVFIRSMKQNHFTMIYVHIYHQDQ